MPKYTERDSLLKKAKSLQNKLFAVPLILDAIEYAPVADVVSREVFEQVKWERDTALQTLQEHGIGLGEIADVVEVKHGEWEEIDNLVIEHGLPTVKGKTWRCSICGEARKNRTAPDMNYCPNCGAKMDLKEGAGE
jgi:rubrerythrin